MREIEWKANEEHLYVEGEFNDDSSKKENSDNDIGDNEIKNDLNDAKCLNDDDINFEMDEDTFDDGRFSSVSH